MLERQQVIRTQGQRLTWRKLKLETKKFRQKIRFYSLIVMYMLAFLRNPSRTVYAFFNTIYSICTIYNIHGIRRFHVILDSSKELEVRSQAAVNRAASLTCCTSCNQFNIPFPIPWTGIKNSFFSFQKRWRRRRGGIKWHLRNRIRKKIMSSLPILPSRHGHSQLIFLRGIFVE